MTQVENTQEKNRYFYQSIPYYDHKVYKCRGIAGQEIVKDGKTHEEYYKELFEKYDSPIVSLHRPNDIELHKVMVVEGYLGDRINEDLSPFYSDSLIGNELKKVKEELKSEIIHPRIRESLENALKEYRRILWGDREDFEFWESKL